jgi:hypothetical protein
MPVNLKQQYVTPVTIVRARVKCEVRGLVTITGMSKGPIPWPIGSQDGQESLVVYKGLAKAVREESEAAVAAQWRIPVATVRKWKEKLARPVPTKPPKRRTKKDVTPAQVRPKPGPHKGGKPRKWTPEEDEIVRTKPMGEAEKLLRVCAATIVKRRLRLGVGLHDFLSRD